MKDRGTSFEWFWSIPARVRGRPAPRDCPAGHTTAHPTGHPAGHPTGQPTRRPWWTVLAWRLPALILGCMLQLMYMYDTCVLPLHFSRLTPRRLSSASAGLSGGIHGRGGLPACLNGKTDRLTHGGAAWGWHACCLVGQRSGEEDRF